MPIFGLHSVVQEIQSFTMIPVMTDFSKQMELGMSVSPCLSFLSGSENIFLEENISGFFFEW